MESSAESDKQLEEEQSVVPATEAEVTQPAESDGSPKKPRKRSQGKQKPPRRTPPGSRKNQPGLQQVTDRFAACGRCSYFWTGYRIIFGKEALETAVAQSESGWLNLQWNLQMPELVHKSYGVRLDIAHFHYEGSCKECRRTFVYEAAQNDDEVDAFRVEISPRTGK